MILMGLFLFLNFPTKNILFAGADRCGSRQPTCHHFRERGPFGSVSCKFQGFHVPKWEMSVSQRYKPPRCPRMGWFSASLCVGSYILLVYFAVQCRASLHILFVFCNRFWDLIFDKHRIIQNIIGSHNQQWQRRSCCCPAKHCSLMVKRYCKLSSVSSEYGQRSTQQVIKDLTMCVWFFRIVSEKPKRVSWRSSVPEASEISNAFFCSLTPVKPLLQPKDQFCTLKMWIDRIKCGPMQMNSLMQRLSIISDCCLKMPRVSHEQCYAHAACDPARWCMGWWRCAFSEMQLTEPQEVISYEAPLNDTWIYQRVWDLCLSNFLHTYI